MNQRVSRRHYLAGLSLGVLASAVAACSSGGSSAQPPAPTQAPAAAPVAPTSAPTAVPTKAAASAATAPTAQSQPAAGSKLTGGKVVIGVINDQSGVYSDISGVNGVKAAQMAVDDFSEKYGKTVLGGPVEVISADHQNKPDLASQKAQEFYERNGCDVIVDVPTSSCGLAVATVAAQKKKLYINVGSATTDLTGKSCNRYTFHYAYDTYMLANGTGSTITKSGGKKWYIIYPNYAFGQDMNKQFTEAVKKAGGTIIGADGTPFPNTGEDFSSYLLKAAAAKPDVIGAMHAGQEVVNLAKQFNEFKLKDQGINLAVGLLFLSDINALPDGFASTQYTTAWYWNLDDQAKTWADKFQKISGGKRPTFNQAANYSAVWQYLDAVRRAGTDESDAIVKQLEGFKFQDFFARNAEVRAEDHRVSHDAYLAQVKTKSEIKEPWDYSKVLKTIPATEAFRPASASLAAGCKMG